MSEEKKRNVGIELFRILMMLGIVATHVCWQKEFATPGLGRLSETCVVGFAMISGYFGIRVAPSKLIRLYALAIGYCFLVPIVGGVMPWGGGTLKLPQQIGRLLLVLMSLFGTYMPMLCSCVLRRY